MRYSINRIYVLVESAITNLISIIEIRASILSRKPKGGVKFTLGENEDYL